MKKILNICIMLFSFSTLIAQNDFTLYHMSNIQQSAYLNPANTSNYNVNIAAPIPGLSGIYFNFGNTLFTPNILFKEEGGSYVFQEEDFVKSLSKRAFVTTALDIDLISFSFRVKNMFFGLNVTERVNSRFSIPKNLMLLSLEGNAGFEKEDYSFADGEIDLSGLGVDMNHFREYGVLFKYEINEKLAVATRIKYLYGMENITTKKSTAYLHTDPVSYDLTTGGELQIRSSGVYGYMDTLDGDNMSNGVSKYLFGLKNHGFGMDLGVNYQLTDDLNLSASMKDFGFIRWKSDVANLDMEDSKFVFEGLNMNPLLASPDSMRSDEFQKQTDSLADRLEEEFNLQDNDQAYTSFLTTRLYFGAAYRLFKKEKAAGVLGGLVQLEVFRNKVRPSFTLSYNQHVGQWLTASVSYTMTNKDFTNLGFGLQLGGPVQFYVIADNVLAGVTTSITNDEGDGLGAYPSFSRNVHFRMGLNIAIKPKDKEVTTQSSY